MFAHHWPDAPTLGEITMIGWPVVPPVDVLCGGLSMPGRSTVGKRAGLAPGARSGLWSHMAEAIDALQPQLVVIENVLGLLSSPAVRAALEGADMRTQLRDCNPSRPGTRPVGSGRQRSSTSPGSRRRTRRFGRPRAGCAVDRPTSVPCRCPSPQA
ncbi:MULTISPECIES: DNA cytosine methyltransferase [unclassified Microbacterium]|uniref:DNA cytosine methyltransferase n=1 Tax=unclassified Microbacterium TaxID=2609290 RepID=UPI00217D7980|nr:MULTISPECIES: DNA cytosine methyltransferase [unclassified Microbacterium]